MKKLYKKAVTFSYDDGVVFDGKLIDIFNKYGIKATFNLTKIDKNEEIAEWTTGNGIPVRGYNFLNEKMYGFMTDMRLRDIPDTTIGLIKLMIKPLKKKFWATGKTSNVYSEEK